MARVFDTPAEGRVNVKNEAGRGDESIRWRGTFFDAVTNEWTSRSGHSRRARAGMGGRCERGDRRASSSWSSSTPGADETIDRGLPREDDDEGDQGLHPPGRGQ